MYAQLENIRLAYAERGRANSKTLLLIHGFPMDHRLWDAQLAGLSNTVRVIAPDLRGAGRSDVPSGPYRMDQYADDLVALLDYLEIGRAAVGGLSMGGYVAFATWRRYPERVAALALLDTRAEPDSLEARTNRDATIERVPQMGVEAFAREQMPKLLAPASLADPRIAARALAVLSGANVPGIVATLASLRDRPDSRPILGSITVPSLALAGAEDQLTPPSVAEAMAQAIPDSRLVIVPRAGHMSPLEQPRAVNRALRRFLADVEIGD